LVNVVIPANTLKGTGAGIQGSGVMIIHMFKCWCNDANHSLFLTEATENAERERKDAKKGSNLMDLLSVNSAASSERNERARDMFSTIFVIRFTIYGS
jgi:hypothetical protein